MIDRPQHVGPKDNGAVTELMEVFTDLLRVIQTYGPEEKRRVGLRTIGSNPAPLTFALHDPLQPLLVMIMGDPLINSWTTLIKGGVSKLGHWS